MKLVIYRTYYTNRTEGKLTVNDTEFRCDTIERAWGISDHPCIPEGTYEVGLYFSPKNNCSVPLLKGVPGRSMIEIHPANRVSELLGCIAVGVKSGEQVMMSRVTFSQLMKLLDKARERDEIIELTIKKQ